MGALEFIASIIGSLAWPGVVLVVLWYNRHRLANLPDWIEELTFPGGAKIKFAKALTEASARAEQLMPEVKNAEAKDSVGPDPMSDLANQLPEAAVIVSFREVEQTLGEMVRFLALPMRVTESGGIIAELVRRGYIDENTVQLFQSLKDARDASLRTIQYHSYRSTALRLWPEQALRYREAAKALNIKLREVLASLERSPRTTERDITLK
jgi:hypothetical protein